MRTLRHVIRDLMFFRKILKESEAQVVFSSALQLETGMQE